MQIGLFDHVEYGDRPLGKLFDERLRFAEAADAAGLYCLHVAEHHATPLNMVPVPGVYLGAVARTKDGDAVVVGRVAETGFATNDLWAAKLDVASGRLVWQRAYEGELGDLGSAVTPLADGGLAMGGTWAWGFPGEAVWVQHTDATGDIAGCSLVRTTSFETVSPPLVVP